MNGQKALLIVDLQKGFEVPKEVEEEILRISNDYDVVVATKFQNGNKLFKCVRDCEDLTAEELELCELPSNTKVFGKESFGLPSEVIEYLREKDVTSADVVGYQTEACVLAATFQLWDAEIEPVILEHLVGTRERYKEHHESALAIMRRNFAKRT